MLGAIGFHLIVGDQRKRAAFAGAVAGLAIFLEDGRDVFGEGGRRWRRAGLSVECRGGKCGDASCRLNAIQWVPKRLMTSPCDARARADCWMEVSTLAWAA